MEIESANTEDVKNSLKGILRFVGDDPEREGLLETPDRMIRSWKRLFGGYKQKPEDVLKTFKDGACNEMVILKDIEFYSTCEHHFIPFFGSVDIGYIPNGKVVGISKLARLVEVFSRRLQIQERMTTQIADAIMKHLDPQGVMVRVRAQHLCMLARGVEKKNSIMITSAIRGIFTDTEARAEFLNLIKD